MKSNLPETDDTIVIKAPAGTKARWVRQSQREGKKLSDWLAERVERFMNYEQLCGALGVLKSAGVDLPWVEINDQLISISRLSTTEMEMAAEPMLRQYRNMCLERGLMRRGELFNISDCVSLA